MIPIRNCVTHSTTDLSCFQVRIPDDARADGWMSYDATEAVGMKKGSYVKLSTATIPLPTVSSQTPAVLWETKRDIHGIRKRRFGDGS